MSEALGSYRRRYQTDLQPDDAAQYTARCPGVPPALAATAGGQSQIGPGHDDQLRLAECIQASANGW